MLAPVALLLPLMFMGIGFAVDVSMTASVKSKLAAAADSAVIAAARALGEGTKTDEQVKELGEKYFAAQEANLDSNAVSATPRFTIDRSSGKVSVEVSASVSLLFGQLIGMDTMSIPVKSSAQSEGKNIELAMVLDVTGSMLGSKLRDLKTAAAGVVDALLTDIENSTTTRRIALVPFAEAVNAGSLAASVTNNSRFECVYERSGTERFTDAAPSGRTNMLGTSRNTDCPSAEIQPLTTDASSLKSQISSFRASGGTAGHIGAAWGWYLISPKWASLLPADSDPVEYDDDQTIKAVILMTDGEFNTWYVSQNGSSTTQASSLCTNMKAAGVIVYAVAFDAPASAQQLLSGCATSSSYYYTAETGSELIAAFENISKSLNKLRLTE